MGDDTVRFAMTDLFEHAASRVEIFPVGIPVPVCDCFERLALEVKNMGFKRYSADALLHRIRWHFQIEKGDRAFKCNNNWTAPLARWFLAKHPDLPRFFETRERTGIASEWIDA